MAKGQMRSNREIRKPKKPKAVPKPESSLGNQVKMAATGKAASPKQTK